MPVIQSPRVSSYRERSSHGHSNDRGMGRPLSFESIVPSPPPFASSAGTMDRDLLAQECKSRRVCEWKGGRSSLATVLWSPPRAAGPQMPFGWDCRGDLKAGWLPRPVSTLASGRRSKHRASLSVDVGAGGGHVTTMQMAGPACGDGLGLALPFREASEPAGGGR